MMTEINDEKRNLKLDLKSKKQKILKNAKAVELGLMQVEVKEKNILKNTNKS
jgi:hypothetical protein